MNSMRIAVVAVFCACMWASSPSTGEADQPRLYIDWPAGWEYRPPLTQASAVHLQARQRRGDVTIQQLSITAIDAQRAQSPVTPESIEELAMRLRNSARSSAREQEIAIRSLSSKRGYYFVATDRNERRGPDEFAQMIEGVLLESGYLINFTLLTDDAGGEPATAIMQALNRLHVD